VQTGIRRTHAHADSAIGISSLLDRIEADHGARVKSNAALKLDVHRRLIWLFGIADATAVASASLRNISPRCRLKSS